MKLSEMKKCLYYNKRTKELVFKINRVKYIIFNLNFHRWKLGIHKFFWGLGRKKSEWNIDLLCLRLHINNYGVLIQDKEADEFFRLV